MKKIYSILFAATALFAASCQKEISNPEIDAPKGEVMTITATTDAETKTTLNGMATLWAASDQISVFDSNKGANNRCFEINDECDGKETATFSYEGEFVMPQNGQTDPTVVALYPYQENAYCDFFYYDHADITGLNIEAEQTAVKDGFDADATFAIALGTLSTKDELKFSNLYSLLKFTVLDAGVKEVTVTVEGEDAFIAGDARIDLTINLEAGAGKPVFENPILSAKTSKTVTLSCDEGFEIGKTYYIAVAPTSYTGISVALDGTTVKTSDNAKTLEKNKVYNLGELAYPTVNVYMKPSSAWQSNAKSYGAYVWNTSGDRWYEMEDTDEDGIYEVSIPTNYENVIFVSMKDTFTANWDNKYQQTADLVIPTDNNNAYVIYKSEWQTLADAKAFREPDKVCKLIVKVTTQIDWYDKYIYCWTEGSNTAGWPGTQLAWDKQDGDYYVYYHVFPGSLDGKTIDFCISKGEGGAGKQTNDLSVTLNGEETTYIVEIGDVKQQWKGVSYYCPQMSRAKCEGTEKDAIDKVTEI